MKRKLLTNGNAFKRTDNRWCGVVWYMDEQGNRKRKSFSGTTKQEANKKITTYIAELENQVEESDKSKKLLKDSIQNWLEIFKFPAVEQTTYDRCECTAQNQVYPILGDKVVGDIVAADMKNLLNHWMHEGLSFSTVKKAYVLLNEYFRTMYLEEMINKKGEGIDRKQVNCGASEVTDDLVLTPKFPDFTFVMKNLGEEKEITLVPYGCTKLRLTVFPKYV